MSKGINILHALFFAIALSSCEKEATVSLDTDNTSDGKIEVTLPVSYGVSTRTELDPNDDTVVRWSIGDQVALWADGATSSSSNLVGEMFQLKYYNQSYNDADFSGSINPMSSGQDYEYCAFYPYTTSFSGKVVSYTLPATQLGGLYDGQYDFRVGDCVVGSSLTGIAANVDFSLTFRPLTHAFRITIPEGYNNFGYEVSKLVVTMPVDVIGTYSVDITNPDATPSIISGSANKITVDLLGRTITDGDGEYVWVFFNPVSDVTGDILITGIGPNEEISYDYAIPVENHTFAAGHITPINTEIGVEFKCTTLKIKVDTNSLGEELTNIILTAPSGAKFVDSGTNVISIDGEREFIVRYETIYNDIFKSTPLEVQFESEHTLFSTESISLSDVVADATNEYTRNVPYLLSEDFTSISYFSYYDNSGIGGDWDSDAAQGKTGQDLSDSDYGSLSTSGWTANRAGAQAGTAIRITGRYEYGVGISGHYEGRLDSPQLSKIKSGVSANVNVTFKFKGGRYSMYYGQTGTTSGWIPIPTYGYINGGTGEGQYNYGSTVYTGGLSGEDDIQSPINSSYLTLPDTQGGDSSSSQDYNNIDEEGDFTIVDATSATRASWRVTNTMDNESTFGANGNFWMYIDDIYMTISN